MATTVSAKIYEHHEKADGTFNVKYVVYHKGERKFIDSPHFVSRRQINKDYEIKDKVILKWIDEQLDDYRLFISSLKHQIEFLSCEQLRDYVRDSDREIDIVEFANSHIEFLKSEEQNREPYSRTFRKIKNSLIDYFGRDQISVNEIHANMLYDYERFLKKSRVQTRINQLGKEVTTMEKALSKGGLQAHMRDLRTLFNEARNKHNNENIGLIKIKHYPFKQYKVGAPPPSRKRNIDIELIREIRDCKVPEGTRIELARDLFMLSFYLCGTNAVDFYHATTASIVKGRFEYNRSKTESRRQDQAFISISIPEDAKPLLEKYLGKLNLRYGAYDYLDWALHKGMKGLREIVGHAELTLYWARHSFGTLARNKCRMSVDDVAVALNHIDNGHKTTDIYIDKDWSIVDDVQCQVIQLIKQPVYDPPAFHIDPTESRRSMRVISA
ncbi:site-specific integrase [Mucilaginibacter rubeus]|uniref:Phage integrase SAM-like domain-containing protein n=1 Tax=Mucilaginibacter rubeus TaxID=2027860 RepID=A0AAE6MHY5_9SPHI|nr:MULTISPECIES: phage integrase SAM-like domain-containing protein [Mucilaginibacter]QEM03652.1 site-specific integrase [Mucilaginibacter rubeus]QEM16263.1 site-specific integrase [Mucilaginibacter gossypii]QTE40977.1 phage integrase SAM-like domain-containing protein [Mucilaginibacter rubeus]QTE47580.1 phage integrase SAM-like domain-containing protein [Mucilaginibacter rubeus]QTE58971.1 phage integrase SAM-like domain-containing protein [Mucilaginibacter rubeus]